MLGKKLEVKKYGGTSVGSVKKIQAIAAAIAEQIRTQPSHWPVVVVSAMAGETNRLVGLVDSINPGADKRHYDLRVSAGEQVSCALMAAAFEKEGIKARGCLAHQIGIYTDGNHGAARIDRIDVSQLLSQVQEGVVPVVAGFQGISKNQQVTTLGRGGSDTSAVALAAALGAVHCEINTDVDGMYTGDPRYIKGARRLDLVDFDVALEMAAMGSKVLHPRCVELASKYDLKLSVRNTFHSDVQVRTEIMRFSQKQRLEAPVVSGISLEKDVARVSLANIAPDPSGLSEVFSALARANVNVDIIVHNDNPASPTTRMGFTVKECEVDAACKALTEISAADATSKVTVGVAKGLSKLSVVGLGMITHCGVASQVFEVLSKRGIKIEMVSTSEIKISVVVASERGQEAAQALHDCFISTL